jgi:hypothetical protein
MVISELAALGMPVGAKFDAIVDQVFGMQLNGRGKTPEERVKILRKLSGIKEQPKKPEKEKKSKAAEKSQAALAVGSAARQKHAASEAETQKDGKRAPTHPGKPAASAKSAVARPAGKKRKGK